MGPALLIDLYKAGLATELVAIGSTSRTLGARAMRRASSGPVGTLSSTRAEANRTFDGLALQHPFTVKRMVRLRFPANPYAPASRVDVVRRN